jgi:DNA repair protein RadB
VDYIAFACPSLDSLLEGGVETGCVTLIYGEAGTGKTNLCLVLARNVALAGKKVIYIDTEGVSDRRLEQVCGEELDRVSKMILFSQVHSFADQDLMIEKAIRLAEGNQDIGLIVVDSMTMYYRLQGKEEERLERRILANESARLLTFTRKVGVPVVITSQVYMDIEKGTSESLGGNVMQHNAKVILKLDRVGVGKRRVTVIKHRHVAEGRIADFAIVEGGISC